MEDFLIRRLTQTSTWAGLFLVASAWGLNFTEQQQLASGFMIINTPNFINSWPIKPVAKWKILNGE